MRFISFFCLILLCLGKQACFASERRLAPLSHETALIKGLQIIDQGQWRLGEQFISQASGTLAGRVFYWLKYSANLKADSKTDTIKWYRISRFIKAHKNWPNLTAMQKNAEHVMPSDLSSQEIIAWFTAFPAVTPQGEIRFLDALFSQGKKDNFQKTLTDYWTQNLFGEKAQEEFLNTYRHHISMSSHKKRLRFLLAHRYYDTALHLTTHMSAGDRALVIAVKGLAHSSNNVNALVQKVPRSHKNHPALMYERIKWRRKKNLNQGAMDLLAQTPSLKNEALPYRWWKERHIMIRRLIEEKDYERAYHLASHHKQTKGVGRAEAEFMAGWLALRFAHKPHQALQHFQTLYRFVKTPISKSRGAYWAGRAAQKIKSPQHAQKWFRIAASYKTTYYGQKAFEQLPPETNVASAPSIHVSDAIWSKWNHDDRVAVMRLFHQAGQEDRALHFLAKMLGDERNTPQDFMALATITRLMRFRMGEVKTAKKAAYRSIMLTSNQKDYFGYPVVSVESPPKTIKKSHIHAIIRQESEFNPKAQSPAGAKGYMQLMPATAKSMAKKSKVKHKTSWLIHRPSHNILLGSAYLGSLMGQYRGSLTLSAAAYNAGPQRVKEWIALFGDPRSNTVDEIDWIELIPFSETRNYVQRVREAEFLYRNQ